MYRERDRSKAENGGVDHWDWAPVRTDRPSVRRPVSPLPDSATPDLHNSYTIPTKAFVM